MRKKKAACAPCADIEAPVRDAEFSTGVDWTAEHNQRAILRRERMRNYIRRYAIPVKPKHVDAQGVAMDEAISPGIGNAFNFQGGMVSDVVLSWFVSHGFIGHQTCAILAQHWLIAKACDMTGEDAVAGGWKVCRDDGKEMKPEGLKILEAVDKRYNIAQTLQRASFFRNVFGIRLCLFVFSDWDDRDYELPFDPDRIKPGTYRGISQIDPYWTAPLITASGLQVGNRGFYVPEYWQIRGKKIHRSHFVILYGKEVPDVLKPSYIYGGVPLTQRIYERVYAAERSANEAPQLAQSKRLTVRYVDMPQALADQETFEQAINFASQFQDNYGTQIAGLEERVERHETSLADLDSVIMTQFQLVAAIAEVPATKLLGTSPKGFGASGDYEIKSYHEKVRQIQTRDFERILSRHYLAVARSELRKPDLRLSVAWEPLDKPSAAELATINKTKADTDAVLQSAGAIDGHDIRKRIIEDGSSGYTGIEFMTEELPEDEEQETAFNGNQQNQTFGNPPALGGQPQESKPGDVEGNEIGNPGGSGGTIPPRPDGANPGDDGRRNAAG